MRPSTTWSFQHLISVFKQANHTEFETVIASQRVARMRAPLARNDVELQTRIRIPRRETPGLCMNFVPPKTEGVGNAGCPWHPRPRVHLVVAERTRVTTSTPESPGVPARNGFNGFLRALPGDRALLPPSLSGYVLSKP